MIIKMVSLEITRNEYYKIMADFNGRLYGNYHGDNIGIYRNLSGKYFIQSADRIARIIK